MNIGWSLAESNVIKHYIKDSVANSIMTDKKLNADDSESFEIEQDLGLREEWIFDKLIIYISTLIFISLAIIVIFQVTVRQFRLPIDVAYTGPTARFLFVIGTYWGMAVASRNDEHIRLTLFEEFLGDTSRIIPFLNLIVHSIIIIVLLVTLYGTSSAMINNWPNRILGGVLVYGWLYLGITSGITIALIYEIMNFYESLTESDVFVKIHNKLNIWQGGKNR